MLVARWVRSHPKSSFGSHGGRRSGVGDSDRQATSVTGMYITQAKPSGTRTPKFCQKLTSSNHILTVWPCSCTVHASPSTSEYLRVQVERRQRRAARLREALALPCRAQLETVKYLGLAQVAAGVA
jgi:hypothetical protein